MDAIGGILENLVLVIEIVSACILLLGFGKAALRFIHTEWGIMRKPGHLNGLSQIRLTLGTYILLGLDFYIVSDIIHSMIKPELNALLNLALIVVMRTTIGIFLSKEIAEIEKSTSTTI